MEFAMVRRDQNRNKNKTKKPTATLDLKAEKVSEGPSESQTTEGLESLAPQDQNGQAGKNASDNKSSDKAIDQTPEDHKTETAEDPSDI